MIEKEITYMYNTL